MAQREDSAPEWTRNPTRRLMQVSGRLILILYFSRCCEISSRIGRKAFYSRRRAHNAQLAVGLGAAPIARFAQNDEAFSKLQIEFSLTLKCFGTMVTTSQVEPRQNSVKCSSSAASTRSPFRYVPFAESRSHSRTMSCVTPTAQCKAETCGSSISMSAPPPARPMLVLAWVSWYTRGLEGPPFVTVIVIVMFLGAHRSMSEGNAQKGPRL